MVDRIRTRQVLSRWGVLAVLVLGAFSRAQLAFAVPQAEQEATKAVRGDYQNIWYMSPPTNPAWNTSATITFNGHVGPYTAPGGGDPPTTPSGGGYRLEMSAFGHPIAKDMPYPAFETDAVQRAGKMLYYDKADPTGPFARDQAAFRYKQILYSVDDTVPAETKIRANFEQMTDHYGNAERDRSLDAERLIRNALKYAPLNIALRNSLLDIYYDRAAAELAFAKERLVAAYRSRMDPPPPGGFVIDGEIANFKATLPMYDFALQGYFELMRDPLGVKVLEIDATATDEPPCGYYVFQQEVPLRSLYEATFQYFDGGTTRTRPVIDDNEDGVVDDRDPKVLFSGYKDLVLLFNIQQDLGKAVVELARRYTMRGSEDDVTSALLLIREAQTTSYIDGNIVLGIFPGYSPGVGDASGIAEAINGWRHSLSELSTTKDFITGKTNLLGFESDFLMLVQKYPQAGGDVFDSYDALRLWLVKDNTAPLTYALQKLTDARASYDAFRGHQDQLFIQFQRIHQALSDRLFYIVGVHPGEAGYNTPEENEGSEINLQVTSIEIARNRIRQNNEEILNLQRQVAIEVDRRASETAINADIQQIYIDYGEKQAKYTYGIAAINATQAIANNLTNCSLSWACAGINAAVQAAGEIGKGALEAEKEKAAANERADIRAKEDALLDVNSRAQIKTWLLRMNTLVIESLEASLVLKQEVARLRALYDEKADLERRIDQTNEGLSERYFADPIHRLRMQSDTIEAEMAFQEAQKWFFFTARALEYKWNQPFIHTHGGHGWSGASLFKLRNAEELEALAAAMTDWDGQLQGSLVADDFFDWFSVRDDFMGFKRFGDGGTTLTYTDPDTGEVVNAVEAFRRQLRRQQDPYGNIILAFSTVRELPGQTFFLGPRFDENGQIIQGQKGTFLDKIEWLKIRLPGNHTVSSTQLRGQLTYGGTAFIRNFDVGTVPNPARPDRVVGEMTAYSTRYWFFHGPTDSWRFRDALTAPVFMALTADPHVEPTVEQIQVFKERSVATSDWTLVVPTIDLGTTVLRIDELNDIELYFYHTAVVRP